MHDTGQMSEADFLAAATRAMIFKLIYSASIASALDALNKVWILWEIQKKVPHNIRWCLHVLDGCRSNHAIREIADRDNRPSRQPLLHTGVHEDACLPRPSPGVSSEDPLVSVRVQRVAGVDERQHQHESAPEEGRAGRRHGTTREPSTNLTGGGPRDLFLDDHRASLSAIEPPERKRNHSNPFPLNLVVS